MQDLDRRRGNMRHTMAKTRRDVREHSDGAPSLNLFSSNTSFCYLMPKNIMCIIQRIISFKLKRYAMYLWTNLPLYFLSLTATPKEN